MAASPGFKVYTAAGKYEAACQSAEIAAAVVSVLGPDATVRWQHRLVVWTEGTDGQAGDSYDHAAKIMLARCTKPATATQKPRKPSPN